MEIFGWARSRSLSLFLALGFQNFLYIKMQDKYFLTNPKWNLRQEICFGNNKIFLLRKFLLSCNKAWNPSFWFIKLLGCKSWLSWKASKIKKKSYWNFSIGVSTHPPPFQFIVYFKTQLENSIWIFNFCLKPSLTGSVVQVILVRERSLPQK